jgi:hypothetical protein
VNDKLYPVEAFLIDDRLWRLVWFGPIVQNSVFRSEDTIKVILTPLKKSSLIKARMNDPEFYDYKASLTCEVGIGLLPYLRIGSIWRHGLPYYWPLKTPSFHLYTTRTFKNLKVTSQTSRAISSGACETYDDSDHRYYIPWPEYYIAEQDGLNRDGLRAKCLVIDLLAEQYDGVLKIIIPCMEILRFYYGNSTQMIQRIIWGKIDDPNDGIYHPSPIFTYFDKKSGIHYLMLGRSIPDVDVALVARLAFSSYAKAQAQCIHDKRLLEEEIDERNTPYEYCPAVFPPFEQPTDLTVQGKVINSVGGKAFLVFSIERCTSDFPFERLRFSRLNDGRSGVADDPERPHAWAGRSKAEYKDGASNFYGRIKNRVEPSNRLQPVEVTLHSERFTVLKHKDIEKTIKYEARYRSAHKKTSGNGNQDLSTAPGSYRISKIRRLYISHRLCQEPGSPPSDFKRFLEVIDNLKVLNHKEAIIKNHGPGRLEISTQHLYFPLTRPSQDRQWSYFDFKEKRRRLLILAKIRSAKKAFYLLDIERRESNSTDDYPMTLIYHSIAEEINEEDTKNLLKYCAEKKGHWFIGEWERDWDWSQLERRKFKHLRDDASRTARRIYNYLLRLTT